LPVLIVAVVLVGILCLLDLLLTLGVIRRLREHSELLRGRPHSPDQPVTGVPPGQVPERFTATTLDGTELSGPAGLRMVGFFASWCSACPGSVAPFIEYVRANQIPRDVVLAVLLAQDEEPPYLGQLAEVAQVSVQRDDSPVIQAFGVSGYPAFCLLDPGGAVITSGFDPAALPASALA
jgi:thiol-disulfide isomerase/thioredoxin